MNNKYSAYTFGGVLLLAGFALPALTTPTEAQAASPASTITVTAPCRVTSDPSTQGLKTCDELLITQVKTEPAVLDMVTDLTRQHVNNISQRPGTAGVQPCALVPNPLVTVRGEKDQPVYPEDRTNRFGTSCGTPMAIKIRHSPIRIEFQKTYPQGSLEDSWFTGAQIQAATFYMNEVKTEISSKKQLTIQAPGGNPSYCLAAATEYQDLLNKRKLLVTLASKNPQNADLLKDMFDCKKKQEIPAATTNFEYGQHGTKLCSNRQALEVTFLNLASCEITSRSDHAYLTNIGSSQAITSTYDWLRQTMKMACKSCQNEACANQCYQRNVASKVAEHLNGLWPIPSSATASSQPIRFGAQTEFAGLGGLFGLAIARRKRKKVVSKSRRPKSGRTTSRASSKLAKPTPILVVSGYKKLLRLLGISASLAIAGFTVTGCNGGSVDENTETYVSAQGGGCPWGRPQFKVECCVGGQLNTQLCTDPNTLISDAVTNALGNTAENIESGFGALGGAAELLGVDPSAVSPELSSGGEGITSAQLSNSSAAVAETPTALTSLNTAFSSRGQGLSSGLGSQNLNNSAANTPNSSSGAQIANSAAEGASSTTLFGNNSGSQAGLTPGAGGNATGDGSVAAGSLGTTPSGGGAGALGAGGAGSKGGGDGSYASLNGGVLIGGANGADAGSMAFGGLGLGAEGGRGPASADGGESFAQSQNGGVNPAGTADPNDYFTRVGMSDSLFKIVTRRYRVKASDWAVNALPRVNTASKQ